MRAKLNGRTGIRQYVNFNVGSQIWLVLYADKFIYTDDDSYTMGFDTRIWFTD